MLWFVIHRWDDVRKKCSPLISGKIYHVTLMKVSRLLNYEYMITAECVFWPVVDMYTVFKMRWDFWRVFFFKQWTHSVTITWQIMLHSTAWTQWHFFIASCYPYQFTFPSWWFTVWNIILILCAQEGGSNVSIQFDTATAQQHHTTLS